MDLKLKKILDGLNETLQNGLKWIPIARTGKFKEMGGQEVELTEERLDQVVTSYKFEEKPAPIVINHPENDQPKKGLIQKLKRVGEYLFALPCNVDETFKKEVNEGKYPSRSMAILKDYSLKHVGFLTPDKNPAIKDLGTYAFSEAGTEEVFYFSEAEDFKFAQYEISKWWPREIQEAFMGLKNYLVDKEGIEKANTILPDYRIVSIGETPSIFEVVKNYNSFMEYFNNQSEESTMTAEEIQKLKDDAEQAKAEAKAKGEENIQLKLKEKRNGFLAFMESDEVKNKVKPEEKESIIQTLLKVDAVESFEFSEADGSKKNISPVDVVKNLIKNQKDVVMLGEFAGNGGQDDKSKDVKVGEEIAESVNKLNKGA